MPSGWVISEEKARERDQEAIVQLYAFYRREIDPAMPDEIIAFKLQRSGFSKAETVRLYHLTEGMR